MSLPARLLSLGTLFLLSISTVNGHHHDTGGTTVMEEADPDVYCLTVHEDLMRRQSDEWGSSGPFSVDDGTKHTPFVFFDVSTRQATVIVGNGDDVGGVFHPMVASDNPTTVHFITHIYVVDQNDQLIAVKTMDPNEPAPATATFVVPDHVTEMTAFEFCNLHGLWMGPTVETPLLEVAESNSNSTIAVVEKQGGGAVVEDHSTMDHSDHSTMDHSTTDTPATVDHSTMDHSTMDSTMVDHSQHSAMALMCHVNSPLPMAFDSFAADFVRRQSLPPFNSLEPYDEDDGTKHTPYIQLHDNGTATVTVGVEGNYHVMKGSSPNLDDNGDRVEPHWITDVYVVDQDGTILTMQSLNPTHVDIAQIHFVVGENATQLTAYEWCNIHGLYRGPTIDAKTGQVIEVFQDDNSEGGAPLESSARTMSASTISSLFVGAMLVVVAPFL